MWRRGLDPLRKLTRGDLRGTEQIVGWRGNESAACGSHLRLVRTCVPSVLTPSVPPILPPPLPSAAPNTAAETAAAATTLTGSGASHSFRTHANGPAEPAADPRLTAAVASAAAAAALGLSAVHSVEAPEGDSSSAGVGSGREGSAGGATPAVDWGGAGRGEGGEGAAVGSKHTARWRVFTDRGRELFSQGRLQDAERYLQRAIEEAKAGFGPSDPHVASSCNNLAELYRVMGEWEAAERLFQEAAERLRALEMPLPLAATLHNLGGLYLQQAQLGQGQLVHSQLGKAELGQAQLEKARVCYEEALKLKAKELGESHPDYANTMFHLAEVFRRLGRREEAQALLRGSVKILEGSAGSRGTTAMARRMMLLAQMLVQSASAPAATLPATAAINGQRQGQQGQQQQGDGGSSRGGDAELLREAERLQRRAIHAVEMGEGTEAPALAGMLASLAATLEKQGRLEEAREALLRSLHLRRSALGADHFLVVSTLTPLAAVTLKMLSRPQQQPPTAREAAKEERTKDGEEREQLEEALRDLHCALRVARKACQQAAEELTAAAAAGDAGGRRGDRVQRNKTENKSRSRNTPSPPACLTLLVQSLATSVQASLTALLSASFHTQRQQLSQRAASDLKELLHMLSTEPARALLSSNHSVRTACLSALQHLSEFLRDQLTDTGACVEAASHGAGEKACVQSGGERLRENRKGLMDRGIGSRQDGEGEEGRGIREPDEGPRMMELRKLAEQMDLLITSMAR